MNYQILGSEGSMPHRDFGAYIKTLRLQRLFFDENNFQRQWTQQHLADEAGLSVRQIARIEQNEVVKLEPLLEALAQAFQLSEAEKVEFYAQAGYVYAQEVDQTHRERIERLLGELHYPALARTPLWDIVAFNEYHRVLWGYTSQQLVLLDSGDLGPNLLRVLFDPQFGFRDMMGSTADWQRSMCQNMVSFRQVSFPYVATSRYRQILRLLQQRYRDFSILWDLSEREELHHIRTMPFTTIHFPGGEPISVMSLRVSPRFLSKDVFISAYIPLRIDDAAYQQQHANISENRVYFFRDQPPE
jgi:transcriptional regulator with XRE-family HTH domain